MSYEPRLLIRKSDLDKKSYEIISDFYKFDGDNVHKYVHDLLSYEAVEFPEISLVICRPELTSFNKDVRELLDIYEIEYRTDN